MWGSEWTGEKVAERLVAVFRELPNTPIYSSRKGVFEPSHPIDGLELITAVQLCLGCETQTCYQLLQWARMRARGESVRAFCLEGGRNRSTFYYRRGQALNRVATFLKRSGRGRHQTRSPSRARQETITCEKLGYR
jgi:hypothetical protein